MDVQFHWEAARLAALHRQRMRRTALLQYLPIPALAVAGIAWLVLQAGSLAVLWAQAPGPLVGLVILCIGWPFHTGLLQGHHARRAARAGLGTWRLSVTEGCLHVAHATMSVRVPCSAVGPVTRLPQGLLVTLHAHLEIPVPAGEPARGLLHMLSHHAVSEAA